MPPVCRAEQERALEKSVRVYRLAEEERHALLAAMESRDSQLQQAVQQMDAMASLHARLVEQSHVLTGWIVNKTK